MTEREKRLALLTEVEKDPLALELLRHKCVWMQKSWLAVLRDFGDPRTWSSYKLAADSAAKKRKE